MRDALARTQDLGSATMAALATLHGAGAHLVLFDTETKRPLWRGWSKRWPGIKTVEQHLDRGNAGVGVIPRSLGCAVVDVDDGDPEQLWLRYPPFVVCDSRGRQDSHGWYCDTERRRDGKFEVLGCAGDIKCNGFVGLWHDSANRLCDRLANISSSPLPDLFTAVGIELHAQRASSRAIPPPAAQVKPFDGRPLEQVEVGNRNVALFHALRFQAYPLDVSDEDSFHECVRAIAFQLNGRFPQPLEGHEVGKLAWSISSWCASRDGHVIYDHSREAQFRRGVKKFYGNAKGATLRKVRETHGLICDLREAGWRQVDIATRVGLSQSRVSRILAGQ